MTTRTSYDISDFFHLGAQVPRPEFSKTEDHADNAGGMCEGFSTGVRSGAFGVT